MHTTAMNELPLSGAARCVWHLAWCGIVLTCVAACDSSQPLDARPEIGVEVGHWTFMGLDGRYTTAILASPAGVHAGTERDGVFRLPESPSHGLEHAPVSALAYTESGGRLLAGMASPGPATTSAAVYVSTDGGDNWLPSDGGLATANNGSAWAFSLTVARATPNFILMGSTSTVMRSVDAGVSWDQVLTVGLGTGIRDVAIAPDASGRIWVSGGHATGQFRFYRSPDWGDTWTELDMRLAFDALTVHPDSAVLYGAVGQDVATSRDDGLTWSRARVGGGFVTGLVFSDDVLVASTGTRSAGLDGFGPELFRSDHAAVEWTRIDIPGAFTGQITALAADTQFVYVGTDVGGVWRYRR